MELLLSSHVYGRSARETRILRLFSLITIGAGPFPDPRSPICIPPPSRASSRHPVRRETFRPLTGNPERPYCVSIGASGAGRIRTQVMQTNYRLLFIDVSELRPEYVRQCAAVAAKCP